MREKDLKCGCGCGLDMDRRMKYKLQYLESLIHRKIRVTSGARCEKHNKAVGGVKTSSHLKGIAADISARTGPERFEIVKALIALGVSRFGIGKTFIHADIDPDKNNTVYPY